MNLTTRARRLQTVTNWPYQTCRQKICDLGPEPARLAKENHWTIDQADAFLLYPSVHDALRTSIKAAHHARGDASGTPEEITVSGIMIPANGSANIAVISEKGPFRLTSIAVPEHVSRDCVFTDIKIGKNSQLVATGAIHGFYFDERMPSREICCDLTRRGMLMTLSVSSLRDKEPLEFVATLKGKLITSDLRQSRAPTNRTMLGIGVVRLAPKGGAKITLQTQVDFTPDCLVIHPNVMEGLRMKSIRSVGREVEVTNTDPVTGQIDFAGLTMQIGDWFCIEVVNEADVPRTFCGAIGGAMVR